MKRAFGLIVFFIFLSPLIILGSKDFASAEQVSDFSEVHKINKLLEEWRLHLIKKAALVGVTVYKRDHRPYFSQGSAFPVFIDEKEDEIHIYYVTNPHVVSEHESVIYDEDTSIYIYMTKPRSEFMAQAEVVAVDWRAATLLLRVKTSKYFNTTFGLDLELLDFPKATDTIWIVGFLGGRPVINRGYVMRRVANPREEIPFFTEIMSEGIVGPGMSGSMVVNSEGQVVGIFYAEMAGHVGRMVDGEYIKNFLAQHISKFRPQESEGGE